jgi:hypothetical protein
LVPSDWRALEDQRRQMVSPHLQQAPATRPRQGQVAGSGAPSAAWPDCISSRHCRSASAALSTAC